MLEGYCQDCHYGYLKSYGLKKVSGISTIDGFLVLCNNNKVNEKFCKFKFFTGGHVEDESCEGFIRNRRNAK